MKHDFHPRSLLNYEFRKFWMNRENLFVFIALIILQSFYCWQYSPYIGKDEYYYQQFSFQLQGTLDERQTKWVANQNQYYAGIQSQISKLYEQYADKKMDQRTLEREVFTLTLNLESMEGFQRAEFLLEHGFLDAIVERPQMKAVLSKILALHENGKGTDFNKKECAQDLVADGRKEEKLTAWQRVELSRRKDRPVGSDYIDALFTDFVEFHGDRYFADDKAIIGGVARFHGMPVTVIAQAKGRNTKENIERNFGMPEPEGYRKALRLMKQAEKFARPVICLVDTPGAFCGLEAEERGQGEAIARNIYEMSGLKVPVVSIIIGEGGSGGALAMATADEVWMLENSIYSILSPEGFASILWKDSSKAKEAAEVMKLTAENLKAQGIVERVFAEPETYTVQNMDSVIMQINEAIEEFLMRYGSMSEQELIRHRYERFRNM